MSHGHHMYNDILLPSKYSFLFYFIRHKRHISFKLHVYILIQMYYIMYVNERFFKYLPDDTTDSKPLYRNGHVKVFQWILSKDVV